MLVQTPLVQQEFCHHHQRQRLVCQGNEVTKMIVFHLNRLAIIILTNFGFRKFYGAHIDVILISICW